MEVIETGFNSTVYKQDDGLLIHDLETNEESMYRFLYRSLAQDLGINSPAVVEVNREEGLLVSEEASGSQVPEQDISNETLKQEFWDIINILHGFEASKAGKGLSMSLEDYVNQRFSKIDQEPDSELFNDDIVYCHRDINPSNLFFDGEDLELIDFGSAEFGPRHYDLAIHANFADRYNFGDYREFYEFPVDELKLERWRNYDATRSIQWAEEIDGNTNHIISENEKLLERLND
ncbi:MAG: phosphotransferase [Candidatus Nanohalobium sp.]